MKNIQPPKFLNDLYRDLRDRRLLFPAIALLVALLAVPVVLKTSSTASSAPVAPETAGGGGASATESAVLTEQLGVTNYRKRLEQVKGKDPFRQPSQPKPKTATSTSTSTPLDQTSSTSTSTSTSTTTDTTSVTSSGGAPPVSPSTSPSTVEPTSPVTPAASPAQHKPTKPTLLAIRADVAVGPAGDLTQRDGVEQGKFLPSESKPIAVFIGATESLKRGLFVLSNQVGSVSGDGRCLPGRDNCTLLRIKVGDEAKLAYAPENGRIYKLKLRGLDLAPIHGNAHGKRAEPASLSAIARHG